MASTDDTITNGKPAERKPEEYVGVHGKPTLRERVGCLPMLAAVLVTAVVLVGVASALRPAGRALGILNPDPTVSATDDGSDPNADDPSGDPSGSPSGGASKPPGRKPGASPTPGALPTTPIGAPPGTGRPTPTGSPSPSPSMAPFTQEAENATLAGGARKRTVGPASGGAVAGNVGTGTTGGAAVNGTVTFSGITAGTAGTFTMTIFYIDGSAAGQGRTTDVSVNGVTAALKLPVTTDWTTVASVKVQVNLKAGANTIVFSNPNAFAADIDKINVQ